MDHFDFGTNSIAAVVIDIGRTKLSDGSWLYEKIKKNLISRAKNEAKNWPKSCFPEGESP